MQTVSTERSLNNNTVSYGFSLTRNQEELENDENSTQTTLYVLRRIGIF